MKRILKRPRPLKFAVVQYQKELPLVLNFNTKDPIGTVTLTTTIDDYLVHPVNIDKNFNQLFATLTPRIAGKVLDSKKNTITKFEILAISLVSEV